LRLRDVPFRIIDTWKRHGAAELVRLAGGRLFPNTRILVLFGLTQPLPVTGGTFGVVVEHRLAARAEVERLPPELLRPDSLLLLDRGDRCLLQSVGGRLAGLVWISTAPVVQLFPGVRLDLPGNAVYTYRTWTDPEFRGRGLQGRRHLATLSAVAGEGRTRLLCFVDRDNPVSLKGVRKSGCAPIGTIRMSVPGDPQPRLRIGAGAWSDVTLARS
jgi:hypothetical protein